MTCKTYWAAAIVLFLSALTLHAQTEVDSLKNLMRSASHDTTRLRLYVELSEVCEDQDILANAKPAVMLAVKLLHEEFILRDSSLRANILNEKAQALNNIGFYYWQKSLWENALGFFNQGLEIREETRDQHGIAESLNNLGELHRLQGNIAASLDCFNRSLKIREEIGDKAGIIVSLNNISLVYMQQGAVQKALDNYFRGLKLAEEINDKLGKGLIFNNIAYVYQTLKDTAKILENDEKSLKIFREIKYKRGIATVLNNMGALYLNGNKKSEKALDCFNQSLAICEETGNKVSATLALVNLGNLYLNRKEYDEALSYGLRSLQTAHETGYPENIRRAALLLYNTYKTTNKYKESLTMHELYVQMSDSILNEETQKSTIRQQLKYDYEKQQALNETDQRKELALAEEGKKRQQIISWATAIGLVLMALFLVFIFNRLRVTRKQKEIIEEQKQIMEEKNTHITASINYAKRIQDSILPSAEEIRKSFPEHFVFFQPCEIVSGDFYWLSRQKNKTILAVADCTGHGVPGAFMSMIGNTLLNEIVNEQRIFNPADILNHLNEGIVHALHQDSRSQDDGMDISLCLFDHDTNMLTFAGAHHSLYVIDGSRIAKITGDPFSIGSKLGKSSGSFSQHEVSQKKNTSVFLTTDGYADQPGGEKGKKFMRYRLEELLLSIADSPVNEQKGNLEKQFTQWKGNKNQVDDILIVGIKI